MEKILDSIQKEMKQIEDQGINAGNIDILYKLVDIEKDIYEIKEKKEEGGKSHMMRGGYMDRDSYGARMRDRGGRYMDRRDNYDDGYGRGGNYRGYDDRIYQHLDRIMEGADDYQYGRDRYRDSGSQDRMEEGLEKLMYALCVFIESMCDFAETPEEKEIIRRHVQKIKNL